MYIQSLWEPGAHTGQYLKCRSSPLCWRSKGPVDASVCGGQITYFRWQRPTAFHLASFPQNTQLPSSKAPTECSTNCPRIQGLIQTIGERLSNSRCRRSQIFRSLMGYFFKSTMRSSPTPRWCEIVGWTGRSTDVDRERAERCCNCPTALTTASTSKVNHVKLSEV